MFAFITTAGKWLDIEPNQDVAFTIEQPFLSTDHLPVPWSTDFNLRLSENNCEIFGYVPAILLPPRTLSVLGILYLNGIPVMPGRVAVLSYTLSSLQVSFKGQDSEDRLTGNLSDLPLKEWNFGKMNVLTEFWNFMQQAVDGTLPEVAAPLILRSDRLDYSQDSKNMIYETSNIVGGQRSCREYWNSRYANFIGPSRSSANRQSQWIQSGTPYLIPAVRIDYLLSSIVEIDTTAATNEYFAQGVVLAPNKKNAPVSDLNHGGLDSNENGDYVLSLAEALPAVETATFVKEILNLFSAAVYLEDRSLIIRTNAEVINDAECVDWTDKIADEFECDYADGQEYQCGYDDLDTGSDTQEIDTDEITEVASISKIYDMWTFSQFDPNKSYLFKIKSTGDIYSVSFYNTIGNHPEFSLVRRGGADLQKTTIKSAVGETPSTFDAKTRVKLVKNIPVQFYSRDNSAFWFNYKAAIADIPDAEDDPSDQIVLGMLQDGQMVSDGSSLRRLENSLDVKETEAPMLMFDEDGLLYKKFHKPFADFMGRPKSEYKISLNLTAADIADLKIWRKRLLYNRLFFIKSLEITANSSTDIIHTEGTFIQS